MSINLSGQWTAAFPNGDEADVLLPGTLDTNGLGKPYTEKYAGKLTRLYSYEGPVTFEKQVYVDADQRNGRVLLSIERSSPIRLCVNGKEIPAVRPFTLNTPTVYDVTRMIQFGQENHFQVTSDNSYPGLPYEAIVYSTTATDETQTNWNGLLGKLTLTFLPANFISALQIYPKGDTADIWLEADCAMEYTGDACITCGAFKEPIVKALHLPAGVISRVHLGTVKLRAETEKWNLGNGVLYRISANLDGMPPFEAEFGIRDFTVNEKCQFTLNGYTVFLRSEANCAVFPETGHPPMTVEEWKAILKAYRAYGINCMRFHSWCPPEAAFVVADRMGMLMQPELSHWNPKNAFENDVDYAYYRTELMETLRWLSNHPSFVMLTFGNELQAGELGHKRMSALLNEARAFDATRLYANASNAHYGAIGPDASSDFYTAQAWGSNLLRGIVTTNQAEGAKLPGHINTCYPSTKQTYDVAVQRVHQSFGQPVFSFEVGQFQVLPDFGELNAFHGVTAAFNIEEVRERAKKNGLLPRWKEYVQATGELCKICYREEIEAALRTEGMGGISLLGLQDFPGQGTALVGMMDSHLQPKPYSFADPYAFSSFFADFVPLAVFPKYTYTQEEWVEGELRFANYASKPVKGVCGCSILDNGCVIAQQSFGTCCIPNGGVYKVSRFRLPLSGVHAPTQLEMHVRVGEYRNTYPIWVYPRISVRHTDTVKLITRLDEAALAEIKSGGTAFLTPPATKEMFPQSIRGQFSTDFWSMGTFPYQDGGMGLLIDAEHPALCGFPTQMHSNWQWWTMSNGRFMILNNGLDRLHPIVEGIDSFCRLQKMALLLEARLGNGRLMISSMGLVENAHYPEVQALTDSILAYMSSDTFAPGQEITDEELKSLIVCMV